MDKIFKLRPVLSDKDNRSCSEKASCKCRGFVKLMFYIRDMSRPNQTKSNVKSEHTCGDTLYSSRGSVHCPFNEFGMDKSVLGLDQSPAFAGLKLVSINEVSGTLMKLR